MGEEVILGDGVEQALITDIAFWVVALSTIVAALAVVVIKDLFRAALFLIMAFLGVAGMFVLLRAEFLAVVQVIIYVGAISVLIIFAILMTRDVKLGNQPNRFQVSAALLAGIFLLVVTFVVYNTSWNHLNDSNLPTKTIVAVGEIYSNTLPSLADLLLRDFVLAFETASVLLLAAIIGALVLIRES